MLYFVQRFTYSRDKNWGAAQGVSKSEDSVECVGRRLFLYSPIFKQAVDLRSRIDLDEQIPRDANSPLVAFSKRLTPEIFLSEKE